MSTESESERGEREPLLAPSGQLVVEPPPHPEIPKYLNPPRKVVKRARRAIEAAREAFNVKEGMLQLHMTHVPF